MATINLAPETQYRLNAEKRRRVVLLFAGAVIGLTLLLGAILWIVAAQTDRRLKDTAGRLRTVETEIARLQSTADRVLLFEQRLTAFNTLLDHHIVWDPLLREIERLLPAPAVLTQLSFEASEGVAHLAGRTPSLDDIAQTLASLTAKPPHTTLFSRAELKSATRQQDAQVTPGVVTYGFTADIMFDPAAVKSRR